MDDPPGFNYFNDLVDLDLAGEMDPNFADPQIHRQPSGEFDQSRLAPGSSAYPGPFDSHFPPTPAGTSLESAQGPTSFDSGTMGDNLGPMMGYPSPQPYNIDYTTPIGVQLHTGPIQGEMTSEEEANSLISQMNQWFNLARESVGRLRDDREQLCRIRQIFQEGFYGINTLFDHYLEVGDTSPTSNGSSPYPHRSLYNNLKKEFVCYLCTARGLMDRCLMDKGTLRRHVVDKHSAPEIFVCQDCQHSPFRRRDKASEHIRRHGLEPQRELVTRLKVELDGPFQCDYCQIWYNTWNAYWKCFQNHSRDTNGAIQPRNNGDHDNNGGGGSYGGGASGAGAGGPSRGQISGRFGGTGHQHSQQGYGPYQSGGYSGYPGYNRHRGASIQNGDSPLSDSPRISTPCSETSSPEPSTLLRDPSELLLGLEKVPPPPPKKMESALTRALHARHASAPVFSRETHLGGLGFIPKTPDHSPPDVDDGPGDKCKSCGHRFKACHRCQTQKHLGDRCHACADKTCSLQQPAPLRIEIPRSYLLSKGLSTTLSESSSPSSGQDDTSLFDEPGSEHMDSGRCGTASVKDLSGRRNTNKNALEEWDHSAADDFLKALDTKDHASEHSLSRLTRAFSESSAQSWSVTTRTWTTEYGASSEDSKLASSNIAYRQRTLSLQKADGEVTMTTQEVQILASLPTDVVSGSLNRSAMLCDPGLRIMLPFLGFYGLGSKADVFTKAQNVIPNIALQGTSFIAKQMQSQHHDSRILRDAASTATKAVSNKRPARLRKKLQAVARVLARYASVANAAPGTDKQAIARKDSFDPNSTTPNGEVTRVGDEGAGPDSQALLDRVCEIISFINTGMTDMFASPEHTFFSCDDDDDDDNEMQWVMAFFWQFLIAILRMRNGALIATEVVACT